MNELEKAKHLIAKGEAVLDTVSLDHDFQPPLRVIDSAAFGAWRSQSLHFLESRLPDSPYINEFRLHTRFGYESEVKTGIAMLQSIREDLEGDGLKVGAGIEPMDAITRICGRFHLVAGQLRQRRDDRVTIEIADEYDVQDLMHALLCLYFEDIRPEEWTPSYAGSSSRMDFLLKQERVVVETKKTRPGLNARKVGEELIIDINRYQSHPSCDTLVCFVYDPEGHVTNPRGVENDLRRSRGNLGVEVLIRPLAG